MNKQIAISLEALAEKVATMFSRKDRAGNVNGETFILRRIDVLSEDTAAGVYQKSTGKYAIVFFYHIARGRSAGWQYFFPTYNHLTGLGKLQDLLHKCEQHNFKVSNQEKVS